MFLSTILSRAQRGIDAPLVHVETHLSNGLPAFNIVGLPATAVRESKERVRSALLNSHFEFPARRITINLAPADLPKEGGRFDLPIALGILAASGQIPADAVTGIEFVGELALDGELRGITGTVGAALGATRDNRVLVVPEVNSRDAALVPDARILAAPELLVLTAHLHGEARLAFADQPEQPPSAEYPDLADVQGQVAGKRALEIAAAGGHHLLLTGPPGTGKTMLASRLPGLLPALSDRELLEVMVLRSAIHTDLSANENWQRPFRTPHHSASSIALVGGGSNPRPGEISLAHCGVLFLDELPEYPRSVLEVLRQPIESREITISRAQGQVTYPAHFQLIAAMNPCPCGYDGDSFHHCRCTPDQIERYRQRVSGPLLDRIDMQLSIPRQSTSELRRAGAGSGETSTSVRQRVTRARATQYRRGSCLNSLLNGKKLQSICSLATSDEELLDSALDRLGLSMRACHRILRVSRTIADLEGSDGIERTHLLEALAYRQAQDSDMLAGAPGTG